MGYLLVDGADAEVRLVVAAGARVLEARHSLGLEVRDELEEQHAEREGVHRGVVPEGKGTP
jgi:hypothetical protein